MLKKFRPKEGVRLADLLSGNDLDAASSLNITSCCCDSRLVREGDLFIAIVGPELDGHDYAQDAVKRGACAVLAERPLPIHTVPVIVVPDSREVYGNLCHALSDWPSKSLNVIGVTGTSGKTTTAALIASVMNYAGFRTGSLGSLGYSDSYEVVQPTYTTPPPPVLANWLGRMEAAACSHAVVEISSLGLSQRRLAGMDLDIACITNIDRAHLNYHNTVENYRRVKASMLDLLRCDGLVVLNVDDPLTAKLVSELDGPALTVAINRPAEITATIVERTLCHQSFLITAGESTAAVRTRMLGDHHVTNCLMATAVGLANGIDLTTIARGLESLEGLSGRMERIDVGQEFNVFLDAARTPHAIAATLRTLKELTEGNLHCVFSAHAEQDKTERHQLASIVEKLADSALLTVCDSEDEPATWIAADVLDGFDSTDNVKVILKRNQAIQHAINTAKPNDTVVILGYGRDITTLKNGVSPINEREFIENSLLPEEILPGPWKSAA